MPPAMKAVFMATIGSESGGRSSAKDGVRRIDNAAYLDRARGRESGKFRRVDAVDENDAAADLGEKGRAFELGLADSERSTIEDRRISTGDSWRRSVQRQSSSRRCGRPMAMKRSNASRRLPSLARSAPAVR